MRYKIELNECEQRMAIWMAKKRNQNARSRNIENARVGDQDDYATDLEGIAAEIAFCKWANVYPDTDGYRDKLDNADATLWDGRTVDVKATKYPNGRLLVRLHKKPDDVDIYVLVTGVFPGYMIVGYMTSRQLICEEMIGSLGNGGPDSYLATQEQLLFVDKLKQITELL